MIEGIGRAFRAIGAAGAVVLLACGASTVRVMGVMRQSAEMRPLPSVALDGYHALKLFVRAAPGQDEAKYGSAECGYARLEGTDELQDLNNAACVPVETLNTAIGLVRQRLRSYGAQVVRDSADPFDYLVEVSVTGQAPRQPDRLAAKALAKVTFTLHAEPGQKTLMGGIDRNTASAAFASIARDCALKDATLSSFASSATQPMTPDFDVVALISDAVDNALRCDELARVFLDASTHAPKADAPATSTP
jgi:hypothetical protein